MKVSIVFYIAFLIPLINFAQSNSPDTLQLDLKSGQKIILIGTDLNSFKTVKADSIIQKALLSIKDSLNQSVEKPEYIKLFNRKRLFIFQPGIGAGLIRDKISPFVGMALDFAPQRRNFYNKTQWSDEYTFINIAANIFYCFEKNASNNYITSTNIFLEGSIGNRIFNNRLKHQFNFDELSFGAGYLIKSEGAYFKNNTFKFFISAIPNNSLIRLRPEICLTDNFQEMFPGINISAKLFGKTPMFQNRHIKKKNLEQRKALENSRK